MNENSESHTNESFFSSAQQQQLKKKITLTSTELIQLTYNEEKFNSKLDELNKEACLLLEEDKYIQAAVYLDEAERILQYAAGCGKTIERTLITTILNNQACLLQRTSEFEQSANYLEAIIYNINEFVESSSPLEFHPNLNNPQSIQYAQLGTFLERKLLLAIYHLRFCALNSHIKNNQGALKAARTALTMLKQLCKQQYLLQQFKDKSTVSSTKNIDNTSPLSEVQTFKFKTLLKDLSNLKEITPIEVHQQSFFLSKCIQSISQYHRRLQTNSQSNISAGVFQNYSIGNLMQASPQQINGQPTASQFLKEELSQSGKLFKVVYLSMAHFTVATQLRYISASKYSLDEEQRKRSLQFRQSKVYHLLSLILLTRYLNSKSVFFQHSLSSFRNHYGIDLLEQNDYGYFNQEQEGEFSVIISEASSKSSKGQISQLEEHNDDEHNNSVHQHQLNPDKPNQLAYNMLGKDQNAPKVIETLMKQIHNEKQDAKNKIKQLKSKSKSRQQITTSFSRVLESNKNMNMVTSKNKENKSKSKMMLSKGKETIRSRRKELRTQNDEDNKKGVYYGFTEKSRSKSKKTTIQRKNSKKGLLTKSGLVFQNKKLRNEVKVDQEYGVRSAGTFGGDHHKQPKIKNIRHSQGTGLDQENVYLNKNTSPRHIPIDPIKIKKIKSPTRNSKPQPTKRKSMSKERYFQ